MPQTIQDSNGASWGAGNMDPLQTAALGVTMETITNGIGGAVSALGNLLNIFEISSTNCRWSECGSNFFCNKSNRSTTWRVETLIKIFPDKLVCF
jgi:hypothetical protein